MIQKVLAEAIGTFTMILIGGGSILLSEKYPQIVSPLVIPIAWGLTIAVMIAAVGHVSGAHFNPAVTLAFVVAKRLPASQIFIYWGSQAFGGLMAVGLLGGLKR